MKNDLLIVALFVARAEQTLIDSDLIEQYAAAVENLELDQLYEEWQLSRADTFNALEKMHDWANTAVHHNEYLFEALEKAGYLEEFARDYYHSAPEDFQDFHVYEGESALLDYWCECFEVDDHVRWYLDQELVVRELVRHSNFSEYGGLYVEYP